MCLLDDRELSSRAGELSSKAGSWELGASSSFASWDFGEPREVGFGVRVLGSWIISWAFETGVMIYRDGLGHSYFMLRGEILGFIREERLRQHLLAKLGGGQRRSHTVLVSTINDAN